MKNFSTPVFNFKILIFSLFSAFFVFYFLSCSKNNNSNNNNNHQPISYKGALVGSLHISSDGRTISGTISGMYNPFSGAPSGSCACSYYIQATKVN